MGNLGSNLRQGDSPRHPIGRRQADVDTPI
jgi:hypothetical protein